MGWSKCDDVREGTAMPLTRTFVPGRRFDRRLIPPFVIGVLDVFAIGFGMGVPIFAILLGFPVGWWLARQRAGEGVSRDSMRAALVWASLLAAVSFVVLAVVWGPLVPNAFDPEFDTKAFGIPLILYTSQASMIGWLTLMIVISPVLQGMAVLTGAVAGFAAKPKKPRSSEPSA